MGKKENAREKRANPKEGRPLLTAPADPPICAPGTQPPTTTPHPATAPNEAPDRHPGSPDAFPPKFHPSLVAFIAKNRSRRRPHSSRTFHLRCASRHHLNGVPVPIPQRGGFHNRHFHSTLPIGVWHPKTPCAHRQHHQHAQPHKDNPSEQHPITTPSHYNLRGPTHHDPKIPLRTRPRPPRNPPRRPPHPPHPLLDPLPPAQLTNHQIRPLPRNGRRLRRPSPPHLRHPRRLPHRPLRRRRRRLCPPLQPRAPSSGMGTHTDGPIKRIGASKE